MKKLKWISLSLTLCFLLGCYEVNEELVINENGSGTFSTKMDMAQLIEMMQSFGGDEMKQEGLDKVVDTVVSMESFADSATDLSAEQKALLRGGKMRMQMNIKENLFKIDTDIPFKSYSDLQFLLAGGGGGLSGLSPMLKKMFNKPGEEKNDQPDTAKDPDMSELGNIYDVTAQNGLLSKKLNKGKFDALMSRPDMEQFKQIGGAGLEVLYTTTIRLPRPVTAADNPLLKISDDKKTITIKYNYLEVFEHPEKFEYKITY